MWLLQSFLKMENIIYYNKYVRILSYPLGDLTRVVVSDLVFFNELPKIINILYPTLAFQLGPYVMNADKII